MTADELAVVVEALECRAETFDALSALEEPLQYGDPAARATVLRRYVAELKGEPVEVTPAELRELDATAYARMLELCSQLYGDEPFPRAPMLLRMVLSYALDLAIGMVAWPSDEASAAEQKIITAGAGRYATRGQG